MTRKNQHVVPVGTKWGVKGEGNSRYTKVTDTQREATAVARSIARNMQSELVIHGKMVVFAKKILMAMTRFHQEVNY